MGRNEFKYIVEKAVSETLMKHVLRENAMDEVKGLLKKFKKSSKDKTKRFKKTKGGGREEYDFKEYERKNAKSDHASASQIRTSIDMENTDIAAVARSVFPNHTDEGAQSQLRKILKGERPMTTRVARKLKGMISRGRIAVK